jgi:hypothetical protein
VTPACVATAFSRFAMNVDDVGQVRYHPSCRITSFLGDLPFLH